MDYEVGRKRLALVMRKIVRIGNDLLCQNTSPLCDYFTHRWQIVQKNCWQLQQNGKKTDKGDHKNLQFAILHDRFAMEKLGK